MIILKESQRKSIWLADRLFTASAVLSEVAVNDPSYEQQSYELESKAHALVRLAGFPDKPTFDLSAWCAQVCADYTSGNLSVIPFE